MNLRAAASISTSRRKALPLPSPTSPPARRRLHGNSIPLRCRKANSLTGSHSIFHLSHIVLGLSFGIYPPPLGVLRACGACPLRQENVSCTGKWVLNLRVMSLVKIRRRLVLDFLPLHSLERLAL